MNERLTVDLKAKSRGNTTAFSIIRTKKLFFIFAILIGLGLSLSVTFAWAASPKDNVLASPLNNPLFVPSNPTIDPISNTHTVPATTTIKITYDEVIDATSVNTRTFAVQTMQTGLLTQTYNVNNNTISVTPLQPLKAGDLVQVSATTKTLNLSSQGPISSTVWQFRIAVNPSTGVLTNSNQNLGSLDTFAAILGDVNGDGNLDIFVANNNQPNKVWLNNGAGVFVDSGQNLGSSGSLAASLGDLDNDGDLDAFIGNHTAQPNEVWMNNGAGTFTNSGQALGSSDSRIIDLGDVDGDGDLDAFVGNTTSNPNKVWLNNGLGVFNDSGQSLGISDTRGIALGDLDGDSDLDAFVANDLSQANQVWLNDGSGNFTDSSQTLGNSASLRVALGDLDNDGDLDAFVANFNQANQVWINNGKGQFSNSGQSLGNSASHSVALGDMNGDGNLDAYVANIGQPDQLWINNGTGTFVSGSPGLSALNNYTVSLGDVDNDGDLDAVIGNENGHDLEVWLNQNTSNSVKVVDNNNSSVTNALVYQNGQFKGNTDGQGDFTFTSLSSNDTLAALQLVYEHPTDKAMHNPDGGSNFSARIYRTSIPVDNNGQTALYKPGSNITHTLVVSPNQALVLFNLVVSVEWDATEAYITELKSALSNASNTLYNVTDGQMAFGWITIFENGSHWDEADIQILAHNQVRPNAFIGGINANSGMGQITYKGFTPGPGHIFIGRYWDGKSGHIGPWDNSDGYTTIAHEFAHYGLFLFDEYFYYKSVSNYYIWQASRCSTNDSHPASLMYYQYTKTEFCNRPEHYNLPTRQTQFYGSNETSWVTIQGIYSDALQAGGSAPWTIVSPPDRSVDFVNGPTSILLNWLKMDDRTSNTATFTKQIQTVYEGRPVPAIVALKHTLTNSTVMTLYQGLTQESGLIDVLGASNGDTICAYTLDIGIGFNLGKCIPVNNQDLETLHLQLCVNPSCPEVGPGHKHGWTGGKDDELSLTSIDGNLTLYGQAGVFSEETQVTPTVVTTLSTSIPSGLQIVGEIYNIEASPVSGSIISMSSSTVPLHPIDLTLAYQSLALGSVDEDTLKIYHYDGSRWTALTSNLDKSNRLVSTSIDTFGIYALMGEVPPTSIYLPIVIKR